jgi:multicomponent Na+:H+ antiporter subunit C
MTISLLYALAGVVLLGMGLYRLVIDPHLVKKILALNISGAGVFLFLVAVADRTPGPEPDPVPHAMVLTGIVVAVSATAVALGLACRIQEIKGTAEFSENEPE